MKKTVLIVDDDEQSVGRVIELLEKDRGFVCIGHTASSWKGLEMISRILPDVVILECFMPGIDGIELMHRVQENRKLHKKPAFVVMSAVGSSRVISEAFAAGAGYFILKPFDSGMLMRKLHALFSDHPGGNEQRLERAVVSEGDPVAMQIGHLLKSLGIGPHLKGYCYLVDAVMMTVKKQTREDPSLTKVTYPAIARMNMTTASRVERAIRHAIELAWEKGDPGRMYEVVARNRKTLSQNGLPRKPTNGEFIACCAAVIRDGVSSNVF